MWKEIKILERPYFMSCHFSSQDFTFTLCDSKQSWSGKVHLDEVKRKVKLLNRRFDYNEEHIRNTLTEGDLETVTLDTVTLDTEDEASTSTREKLELKLKYRVLGRPFQYEWSLKKQTLQEFQATFVNPLFTALIGCQEQIEILKDCLKKKDAEILEYRRSGAILSRKTLATKLFDFDTFSKKYESSNKLVADFSELGKFIINTESIKQRQAPESPQKKIEKQVGDTGETKSRELLPSGSPGQRKRKLQKQKLLETALKTRRKCLEYESSQSQTFSSSQSAEESPSNDMKLDSKDSKPKTESNVQALRPRRASRCTPIKERNANKSSGDSDSDDISKCMSPRKRATRNLNIQTQIDGPQTANNDKNVKDNEKTQKKETPSKDGTDKAGTNNMKSSIHSVDFSNSESDELILSSTRKRITSTTLNIQSEDECPKSGNSDKIKDRENATKNNVPTKSDVEQKGKHIKKPLPPCSQISTSESDDVTLSALRNKQMQTLNKQTQDKNLKSSNNDKSNDKDNVTKKDASNGDDAKQKGNNTKKPTPCPYLSNSESDDVTLSTLRIKTIQKQTTDKIQKSTNNDKAKDKETTQKKDVSNTNCTEKGANGNVGNGQMLSPILKNKDNPEKLPTHSFEISDSETDEYILPSPRRRKTIPLNIQSDEEKGTNSANKGNNINTRNSPNKKTASSISELMGHNPDAAPVYVVEISTDSECDETPTTPRRGSRKRISLNQESPPTSTSTFVLKSRITRSSPQVLTTPTKLGDDLTQGRRRNSINSNRDLAFGEISSQLEAIRKELQSLEALRLADLKRRTCKA